MRFNIFLIYTFFLDSVLTLTSPNKKFLFNYKNPSNDIKLIDSKKAFLVSKNWLDNSVIKIINENQLHKGKILNLTQCNGINSITQLNDFRKNIKYFNDTHIYFSWCPQGCYGVSEILYLIIAQKNESDLFIKYIISSPFWDSQQISNEKLKLSLIDYSEKESKKINFDILYKNDFRHKLSWHTWNL